MLSLLVLQWQCEQDQEQEDQDKVDLRVGVGARGLVRTKSKLDFIFCDYASPSIINRQKQGLQMGLG